MTTETVQLTDEERSALETLIAMRMLGHGGSCACVPCIDVRRVWHGNLDELDRLAAEIGNDGRYEMGVRLRGLP